MCILELCKVLMYRFHHDYVKNKYDNKLKLLFTDTVSVMYEIKAEDVYEDLRSHKEMFDFSNYLTKSKYHNSNKSVIRKMKDETGDIGIEEFVVLKPKMYSFLVDNSKHKKAKGVNKNVVAAMRPNEFKDILLNNKCIRHSMNRIQSKDHRIGTYETNKISLSCFDDKIYLKKLSFQAYYFKFQSNQDSFFVKHIVFNFFPSQDSFFVNYIVLIFSL